VIENLLWVIVAAGLLLVVIGVLVQKRGGKK
jgi:hypothetical protein